MLDFKDKMNEAGEFKERRTQQLKVWMWTQVNANLLDLFYAQVGEKLARDMERKVTGNQLTPGDAADELIEKYRKSAVES